MQRWMKRTALIFALVFTFSLIGCGTAADSSKEQKKDTKTTAVENNKVVNADKEKEQPAELANAAAEEAKPEQAPAQANPATQETKPVQSNSAVGSTNTKTNTKTNTSTNSNINSAPPASAQTPAAAAPVNTTPPPAPIPETKPAASVTMSILGPKDKGTIMGATKVSVEDGDTIFTVLKRQKNIVVDSKGSGASTYIEGINNIYEFDYGAKSGWVFKLNGQSLTRSVGIVTVKEGDRIECIYTE